MALAATTALSAAPAAAVDWVTDANGLWRDAINWSSGLVPSALDDVRISVGGSTVRTIRYDLANSTVQSVDSDEDLVFAGGLTVAGSFSNRGLTTITTNAGNLRLDGVATLNGLNMVNRGTVSGAGVVRVNGPTLYTGPMLHIGPGRTIFNGPVTSGALGNLTLGGGRRVEIRGGFTSDTVSSRWNLNGIADPGGGTLHNAAGSTFLDQSSAVGIYEAEFGGPVVFENAGTFRLRTANAVTRQMQVPLNNTGLVDVVSGTLQLEGPVTGASGTTLTGGRWRVARSPPDGGVLRFMESSGLGRLETNAADITLSGLGAELGFRSGAAQESLDGTLRVNAAGGVLRLQDGASFNTLVQSFQNHGMIELAGSFFAGGAIINSGEVRGSGGITGASISNSGAIRAVGGELTVSSANGQIGGTVGTGEGGRLRFNSNVTVDELDHLGDQILGGFIAVAQDFRNAAAGVGNTYHAFANLVRAQINATSAGQVLSAVGLTGGDTATPVLALGNRRVGDAATVTITNTGTETRLRGAVRDAGANALQIEDGDSFAIDAGGTAQFTVSTAGATPGVLTGQSVVVANNFSNVADQTLTITGRLFRMAEAGITGPTGLPLVVRVGDLATGVVAVRNLSAADGFSEGLGVAVSANGDIVSFGPSVFIVGAAGQRLLSATIDTSSAGLKNGTLDLTLQSSGARSSGLAAVDIGSAAVDFSVIVNNRAAPIFTRFGEALVFNEALGGYVLDLGSVSRGGVLSFDGFGVGNLVIGPADDLSGLVSIMPGGPFDIGSGFDIGLLVAGEQSQRFGIAFDSSTAGRYIGRLNFAGLGTNASDPMGEARFATLFLRLAVNQSNGVVPEPESWTMMILGFGLVGVIGRRRQSARQSFCMIGPEQRFKDRMKLSDLCGTHSLVTPHTKLPTKRQV